MSVVIRYPVPRDLKVVTQVGEDGQRVGTTDGFVDQFETQRLLPVSIDQVYP